MHQTSEIAVRLGRNLTRQMTCSNLANGVNVSRLGIVNFSHNLKIAREASEREKLEQ